MIRKKIRGYTLLEITFVIILVGIIATVAMLKWPGYNINLDAQAQQLAADIRYTQALSMSTDQRCYLAIHTGTKSYQVLNAAGAAQVLPNGNTTTTLGAGISFGTLTNLPDSLIAFSGNGTPYTSTGASGAALSAAATIPLTTGSFTRTITIQPTTGSVSIS